MVSGALGKKYHIYHEMWYGLKKIWYCLKTIPFTSTLARHCLCVFVSRASVCIIRTNTKTSAKQHIFITNSVSLYITAYTIHPGNICYVLKVRIGSSATTDHVMMYRNSGWTIKIMMQMFVHAAQLYHSNIVPGLLVQVGTLQIELSGCVLRTSSATER